MMLRLDMAYVRDRGVAEDVVQEARIVFLRTLDRFDGRSSVKTSLFGILANVARARRRRESRFISFTSLLGRFGNDSRRPSVDPERFVSSGHCRVPPPSLSELPEDVLESRETLAEVQAAIDTLAPGLARQVRTTIALAGKLDAESIPTEMQAELRRAFRHWKAR